MQMAIWDICPYVFFIILLGIKQHNKLWKKTFKTIHQMLCFLGLLPMIKKLYPCGAIDPILCISIIVASVKGNLKKYLYSENQKTVN